MDQLCFHAALQNIPIPAEGEVSTRFYNELMDIQVLDGCVLLIQAHT